MSAWQVQKEHIDVIVKASLPFLTEEEASNLDAIGRMLWVENALSIAHRYGHYADGDRPGPIGFKQAMAEKYTYTDPGFEPTPGETICAIGCLDYQSCEHPGWEASDAHEFLVRIQSNFASPEKIEYEGPWGWDARDVESRRDGAPVITR